MPTIKRAVCYHRCSTNEQDLETQRLTTSRFCQFNGYEVVATEEDQGKSGSNTDRDGLQGALSLLESKFADVLVVAKLDRLCRSLHDLTTLGEKAKKQGWDLVIADMDIDTSTPHGQLVRNILGALAEWERQLISTRTKEALAAKRLQGIVGGRKRAPANLVRRIFQLREQGHTQQGICNILIADGVPTTQGGTWQPKTVSEILKNYRPDPEAPYGVRARKIPTKRALHQTEIPKGAVQLPE